MLKAFKINRPLHNSRVAWLFSDMMRFFYSFELKNKQNIPGCGINAVKGCTFFIDKIDPIKYEVTDGPDLQTGTVLLIITTFSNFRNIM